jgi:hypothetical protein
MPGNIAYQHKPPVPISEHHQALALVTSADPFAPWEHPSDRKRFSWHQTYPCPTDRVVELSQPRLTHQHPRRNRSSRQLNRVSPLQSTPDSCGALAQFAWEFPLS